MHWLLIIFVFAVILTPLMWFKPSPRQKRIASFRRAALEKKVIVSLHRRPDAREGEKRLECMSYRVQCQSTENSKNWVLHRFSQRGWESKWDHWFWFSDQAEESWNDIISHSLATLPNGVSAIIKDFGHIAVIWDEESEMADLHEIFLILEGLNQHIGK